MCHLTLGVIIMEKLKHLLFFIFVFILSMLTTSIIFDVDLSNIKVNIVVLQFGICIVMTNIVTELITYNTDLIYKEEKVICMLIEKRTQSYRLKGGSAMSFVYKFEDDMKNQITVYGNQKSYLFLNEGEQYKLLIRRSKLLDYELLSS